MRSQVSCKVMELTDPIVKYFVFYQVIILCPICTDFCVTKLWVYTEAMICSCNSYCIVLTCTFATFHTNMYTPLIHDATYPPHTPTPTPTSYTHAHQHACNIKVYRTPHKHRHLQLLYNATEGILIHCVYGT